MRNTSPMFPLLFGNSHRMYIIFWLSFTIVMSPAMQVNSSKLHTKNTKTAIGKKTNKQQHTKKKQQTTNSQKLREQTIHANNMHNKCKTPTVAKFWLRIVFVLIVFFLHLFSLLFNKFFVMFKIICFFWAFV